MDTSDLENVPNWTGMVVIAICLLIVIFGGVKSCNEKKEAKKVAAEKYAAAPPPAPRVLAPTERPWSFKTVEIPPEGMSVYLRSGWRGFTQGGAVIITSPGGKIFHDKPGVPTQLGYQPDGMYVFRGDPVGSKRSMVIYNRW